MAEIGVASGRNWCGFMFPLARRPSRPHRPTPNGPARAAGGDAATGGPAESESGATRKVALGSGRLRGGTAGFRRLQGCRPIASISLPIESEPTRARSVRRRAGSLRGGECRRASPGKGVSLTRTCRAARAPARQRGFLRLREQPKTQPAPIAVATIKSVEGSGTLLPWTVRTCEIPYMVPRFPSLAPSPLLYPVA